MARVDPGRGEPSPAVTPGRWPPQAVKDILRSDETRRRARRAFAVTDDDALELLSFLVTAARCLMDEPVDYGPMRLLSAAQRLCAKAAPRMEDHTTRVMAEGLARDIPAQLARRSGDPDGYLRFMDDSCRRIAAELSRRAARTR